MKNLFQFTIATIFTLLIGCEQKKENLDPSEGIIEVVFNAKTGTTPLVLGQEFTTPNGEKLKISDFKFFVSEVKMAKTDASEVDTKALASDSAQSGVWLINFASGQKSFKFKTNVGEYADLRFSISVPAKYNLAEISKNPYPINNRQGMYWSWNSGFKFIVINGITTATTSTGSNVHLSIGLTSNRMDYNFRSLLLAAQRSKINVVAGKTTTIQFDYDINGLLTNLNGSNYSFVKVLPSDPDPMQVHGGYWMTVLKANSAQALNMGSISDPQ